MRISGENSAESAPAGLIIGLPRNLALRIFSTLVILPPVALILVLGGPVFTVLVALIAGCMAWEWMRIVGTEPASSIAAISAIGCAAVVAASSFAGPDVAGYIALAALVALMVGATVVGERRRVWIVAGCVVASWPCLAAIWLRASEPHGLMLVIWLIAAVVATATGAYIAGKCIGGAKLAPRISPNKTWAGLLGGMVASAGVGWICGVLIAEADALVLTLAGGVIAIVAQIGDLLESLFKRRFSVKDSGALIPGHGGVLDRLDGHLTVITVVAIIIMVSGRSPLVW